MKQVSVCLAVRVAQARFAIDAEPRAERVLRTEGAREFVQAGGVIRRCRSRPASGRASCVDVAWADHVRARRSVGESTMRRPAYRRSTFTAQRSAPPYMALIVRPSIGCVAKPSACHASCAAVSIAGQP